MDEETTEKHLPNRYKSFS